MKQGVVVTAGVAVAAVVLVIVVLVRGREGGDDRFDTEAAQRGLAQLVAEEPLDDGFVELRSCPLAPLRTVGPELERAGLMIPDAVVDGRVEQFMYEDPPLPLTVVCVRHAPVAVETPTTPTRPTSLTSFGIAASAAPDDFERYVRLLAGSSANVQLEPGRSLRDGTLHRYCATYDDEPTADYCSADWSDAHLLVSLYAGGAVDDAAPLEQALEVLLDDVVTALAERSVSEDGAGR